MTKIDIFSGFLGAGKTTLIKKLLQEAYVGEKVVLIENEFGEIGIDGGFLKGSGIEITEMNSGCICCSLVGDFSRSLAEVLERFAPDRVLIEPSGVGKLSDVVRAVQSVQAANAALNGLAVVVDAKKCKMYMKNFGEFFGDQIAHAGTVIFSHTEGLSDDKIAAAVNLIREKNQTATMVTTPWTLLGGKQILSAIEKTDTLEAELVKLQAEHHHHHHHEHDENCDCGYHEHHHHEHDENCDCGCHHEHHHHHADDIFDSIGKETTRKYTKEELESVLQAFADGAEYGMILRAKGILPGADGQWLHFDYVPGEPDIRYGTADVIGRFCVIGAALDKPAILSRFGLLED